MKLEKTRFTEIYCLVWLCDEESYTTLELFTDQELRIVTSEEMAKIKKRSWLNGNLNYLLKFCVYVNTKMVMDDHFVNWDLYMLMLSLINRG
jgi:hypothetical protein